MSGDRVVLQRGGLERVDPAVTTKDEIDALRHELRRVSGCVQLLLDELVELDTRVANFAEE